MDIRTFFAEYDEACKTSDLATLEQMLLAACATHFADSPHDLRGHSALYNELGAFYRGNGMQKQGEDAFLKAKSYLETPSTIPSKEGIGESFCTGTGCCGFDMDASLLKWPLSDVDLTQTIDYATTLNNLAGHYRVFGQYEQALQLFQETRERYALLEHVPSDVFASSYNNTGLVYLDMKQPDLAEEYFHKALEIINTMEHNDFVMGTTYNNLSFVYLLRNNKEEACVQLAKAASYFLKLNNTDMPLYKNCVSMLAQLQDQL